MARPGYQDLNEQAAPAGRRSDLELKQLEEEQRLEDLLEDDDVKEALKRLHADQTRSGGKEA